MESNSTMQEAASEWQSVPFEQIQKEFYNKNSSGSEDLKAKFKILWNEEALFVLVDIVDDILFSEPSSSHQLSWEMHQNDCIELYFDINNDHSKTKNEDDFSLGYILNKGISYGNIDDVKFKKKTKENGYSIIFKLDWEKLNVVPIPKQKVGFEIIISDNDTINKEKEIELYRGREATYAWSSLGKNDFWQTTANYGDIIL